MSVVKRRHHTGCGIVRKWPGKPIFAYPFRARDRVRRPRGREATVACGATHLLVRLTMTSMRASGYSLAVLPREPHDYRLAALRDQFVPPMPPSALWGWAGPLLVMVFGGFLRFYRLGIPHA